MVSLKGTLSINKKKRFKVRHHELDRFKVSGPTYWVVFYCLPSLLTIILSSNTSITVKKISKILKERKTHITTFVHYWHLGADYKIGTFVLKTGVQRIKVIRLFPNIHLKTRCVYNRDHCYKRNKEKH